MKILFYSSFSIDSNAIALLLDEAWEYLQKDNNQVMFVTCSSEIKPCELNAEQSFIRCKECMFSTNLLINKITHPNFIHKKLSFFIDKEIAAGINAIKFIYNSIEDVKFIHHQGVNIGLGVCSSYVSLTRNLNPEFNKDNRSFFDKSLRASALLTEATNKMIDIFQPDMICLVNGRYGGLRPVMEVGVKRQIKTTIIECSYSTNRELARKVKFSDVLPHDIDKNTITIEDNWTRWQGKIDKEQVAADFFERRRNAEFASDTVYISHQNPTLLPADWDSSKRNFVIFNSSEDEFFCVGECFDKYKLFKNQIEGILYLIKKSENDPSIHLYLRVHPNLKNIKFNYHTGLASIFEKYPNITVIPASSPISTYKLIDNCEKVLVFGSTAGVEAAYWGKPVILMGGAFYLHLNVAHYPGSLIELDSLLLSIIEPKPRLGALKYALYIFGERGTTAKHVNLNYRKIKFGHKELFVPLCYMYKKSIIPYMLVIVFFRALNIIPHFMFKKIKMRKLLVEGKAL